LATIDELVIELSADTKELQTQMKSASQMMAKSMADMQKSVEEMSKNGAKNTSFFQKSMETMTGFISGNVVLGAFQAVGNAALSFFKTLTVDGIKAAIETETALNDLVQAMTRQGTATKNTRKEMEDFASAMQEVSIFGDDAVLSSAAMIENITGLSKEALIPATKAAIDLASALNIELDAASRLIAKGIEGGTEAFKRYGIQIEEGSSKAENLSNILKGLGDIQGAGAGKLQSFEGQTKLLSNTWQDFTKIIGNAVVQNPAIISAMAALNAAIKDIGAILMDAGPALKVFVAESLKPLATVFNSVAQSALYFMGQMNALRLNQAADQLDRFKSAQVNTNAELEKARAALERGGAGYVYFGKSAAETVPMLEAQAEKIKMQIDTQEKLVVTTMESTTKIETALGSISGAVDKLTTNIQTYDSANAALDVASQKTTVLKTNTEALQNAQFNAKFANDEFVNSLVSGFDTVTEKNNLFLEEYKFQNENKLISDEAYQIARDALLEDNYNTELQQLMDWQATHLGEKEKFEIAKAALDQKYSMQKQKTIIDDQKKQDDAKKAELQGYSKFAGDLATLQKVNSKELMAIGKAAAIAQATIDGYAAVQGSYKVGAGIGGPVLGGVFAAAAGIATAANISKIAATPLATGIDSVPGIGANDNFPAVLAPQERVVPRETNKDLTEFLANQGGSKTSINVNISISDVFTSDPREVGLKIIETINEAAQANGITLLGSNIS